MKIIIVLLMFVLSPLPVMAQGPARQMTIDLAQDRVDITTGFDGAHLSLYGVKKHPGHVVVVLRGPENAMVVRHRQPFFGVWMNRESLSFFNVPVYYDYAVSAPEAELTTSEMLRKYEIGLDSLTLGHSAREDSEEVSSFREALIRNKQSQGHFPLTPKPIVFLSDDFFRADFYVPPDVPTGEYLAQTYLFDNGKIIEAREKKIRVAQVGFSARVYEFAQDRSLLYGLTGIFLAMLSGLAGYAVMRKD